MAYKSACALSSLAEGGIRRNKTGVCRSISHKFSNHADGTGRFLSGRDPIRPLDREAQYPCTGPIVAKMREDRDVGVPNYVASNANLGGSGAANLGATYLPFVGTRRDHQSA